ncbi:MAG: DNRLRE domain-containing protein [Sedimentisphaerales bacterium]|nr:DNRLRE domain-containing protein [Sedimentisphaerales bacterium]
MKALFISTLTILMATSLSFAGITQIVVQPEGDGNVGQDRENYDPWEDVPFDSDVNPNYVGFDFDDGDGQWRDTYIQVNLSSLPAVDDITAATLNINILTLQGSDTISNLYHAADASGATGNAADQIDCSELAGEVNSSSGLGWLALDVTDFIKADITSAFSWAAFRFGYETYKSFTFNSAETVGAPLAPYLEVTSIPEPITASLLAMGALLLTKRKRRS